jgi:hypothetical protein
VGERDSGARVIVRRVPGAGLVVSCRAVYDEDHISDLAESGQERGQD